MSAIIDEIADYRCKEMLAGRNPKEIKLSDEQKSRLEQWIKDSGIETVPCFSFENTILGMKIL